MRTQASQTWQRGISLRWQHVTDLGGDSILTEGLYNATSQEWVVRVNTIGGHLRISKANAEKLIHLLEQDHASEQESQ